MNGLGRFGECLLVLLLRLLIRCVAHDLMLYDRLIQLLYGV